MPPRRPRSNVVQTTISGIPSSLSPTSWTRHLHAGGAPARRCRARGGRSGQAVARSAHSTAPSGAVGRSNLDWRIHSNAALDIASRLRRRNHRDAAQTVLHLTSRPAQSDRHDVTGLSVTPFKTSGDEARFVALGLCARVRRIGGALAGPHVVCDPGPRAWLSRISAKTTLDVERSKVVKTTLADSIQNLSIPRPFASFNVAEPTFA